MTLDLGQITSQVSAMGATAAQRAAQRASLLPVVRSLLTHYASDPELLTKIERAKDVRGDDLGWFGAIPTHEPIDRVFDSPDMPERLTLAAADGSQIYPDPHGPALYYVINVSSIVLRQGSGETPITGTTPTVCFDDAQLYGEGEQLVSSQLINARRAVAEMAQAARAALAEAQARPTVALIDGSLALNVQHESISAPERERLLGAYLEHLDALKAGGVVVAGFISRPGTTAVAKLLELATYPLDEVAARVKNQKGRPFGGLIVDARLFESMLQPGQRSAVFEMWQGWSRMYGEAGHAPHLFYLNVGAPRQPSLARVEVPEWVARDAGLLGRAHAALVDQCRITQNAYPYVLTRADELAWISSDEKANFERMIGLELMRQGIVVGPSDKAATKAIARYGKRR